MADQRFAPPRMANLDDQGQPDGTFWPTLASPTQGEVGGSRHYDGKAPSVGIWKCPACRVENEGPLEQGCAHCGSGAPGTHVGVEPPKPRRDDAPREQTIDQIQQLMTGGLEIWDAARAWVTAHCPHATDDVAPGDVSRAMLIEAFVAGHQLAMARTMKAPPVTTDVQALAPEQKGRRTILAALKLFRDQVLAETPEEIESGEWCSVTECDRLIAEIERTL